MSEIVRTHSFRAVLATWPLLALGVALSLLGVLTIHPFDGSPSLAPRQLVFIAVGITDMRFIRRTQVIVAGYLVAVGLLSLVLIVGDVVQGARSWFDFGFFSFQPSDLAKLVVIALLAKYFSRRNMEIGYVHHIVISGIYTAAIVLLILLQPDLGTAAILSVV